MIERVSYVRSDRRVSGGFKYIVYSTGSALAGRWPRRMNKLISESIEEINNNEDGR